MQPLLSPSEIAERCGITRQHLHALFKKHGKPAIAFENGRLTVYQQKDVMKWVKTNLGDKYADRYRASL